MTEITDDKSKNEITSKTKKPIFSEDEIEETVKAFILAYIHKKIQIRFPTSSDYKDIASNDGEKMGDKEAQELEFGAKDDFIKFIQICSGNIDATDVERKYAVSELFDIILRARSTNRISGSFDDYELKERIEELENKLDATNNVVKQLVDWLIETEDGYDKKLS